MKYGHWISNTVMPEGANGFVYCILKKDTKEYYIGQKSMYKRIKRKPLKGKKRNRIDFVESDWKTYCSSGTASEFISSNRLLFDFYIVHWTFSKTELNLLETYEIIKHIHDDKCLNQCVNIRCRVQKPLASFLNA